MVGLSAMAMPVATPAIQIPATLTRKSGSKVFGVGGVEAITPNTHTIPKRNPADALQIRFISPPSLLQGNHRPQCPTAGRSLSSEKFPRPQSQGTRQLSFLAEREDHARSHFRGDFFHRGVTGSRANDRHVRTDHVSDRFSRAENPSEVRRLVRVQAPRENPRPGRIDLD